jgi:hypothetical protein
MGQSLAAMVAAAFEQGRGEQVEQARFLPIFSLESGTRFGFDESASWAAQRATAPELLPFAPGRESVFFEAVENRRPDVERLIASGAEAVGFDPEAVVLSFPAVELVRAVLTKQSPYFCRLALLFLAPSELRAVRPEIVAIARHPHLPRPLRELAERLTVPE